MRIAELVRDYMAVVAWPFVALIAIVLYRTILASLLPGSRVKLTISGFTIETSLPVIEQSVTESLGGRNLTPEQFSLLKKLRYEGRSEFDRSDSSLRVARPLRNAGLIKSSEQGFLAAAKQIEITALGRLLVEAAEKKGQSPSAAPQI